MTAGTPEDPPAGQVTFRWREVQPIVGILWGRTWTPQYRDQDMLEGAVNQCDDCGTDIPAGDLYCDDCE